MDMNGAAKSEAIAMMLRWERMMREYMDPMPTSTELRMATDYMLQDEQTAKAPWLAHFAIIKRFILNRRASERAERQKRERDEHAKKFQQTKPIPYVNEIGIVPTGNDSSSKGTR